MAWALLWLCVIRLASRELYLLYPFSVLYLLPHWVIEPRYFIPIVAFLILAMRPERTWVEWSTVVYQGAISAWLFIGIRNLDFFP